MSVPNEATVKFRSCMCHLLVHSFELIIPLESRRKLIDFFKRSIQLEWSLKIPWCSPISLFHLSVTRPWSAFCVHWLRDVERERARKRETGEKLVFMLLVIEAFRFPKSCACSPSRENSPLKNQQIRISVITFDVCTIATCFLFVM